MSKTARDVMTPGGGWPDDEPTEAAIAGAGGRVPPREASVGADAIGADDWIDRALARMTELKVHRLAVVDGGRLVGSASRGDLASSIDQSETWSSLCS